MSHPGSRLPRSTARRFRRAEDPACAADEEFASADPIDYDAIAYCAREIQGKDVPSIEEVRRIFSKVPGSMAQAVAEERRPILNATILLRYEPHW